MFYLIIIMSLTFPSGNRPPPILIQFKQTFTTQAACKAAEKDATSKVVSIMRKQIPADIKLNEVADCFTQEQRDAIVKKLHDALPPDHPAGPSGNDGKI